MINYKIAICAGCAFKQLYPKLVLAGVLLLYGCSGGNNSTAITSPTNTSPTVANISSTTVENTMQSISLLGQDKESNALTYLIVSKPSHGIVTLKDNKANYTPNNNYYGTDSFTYKANDGQADSNIATVSITITTSNKAPVANAGRTQIINKKKTVTLDGSASTDSDGSIISYQWKQTAGTNATLINANSVKPTFTAPDVTSDETLSFELMVTDNKNQKASSMVTVLVRNRVTGRFIAPPVSGLYYETATISGETNLNGEFDYKEGEEITFKVGDIVLGKATATEKISPFELAGITPPTTYKEVKKIWESLVSSEIYRTPITFEIAVNLAQFLQTIDIDDNPDNGITISRELHNFAQGKTIDWKNIPISRELPVSYEVFSNSSYNTYYSPLLRFIGQARQAGLWGGSRAIREPLLALDTLYKGMGLTPQISVALESLSLQPASSSEETITYNADQLISQANYTNVSEGTVTNNSRYFEWESNNRLKQVSDKSYIFGTIKDNSAGQLDILLDTNWDGTFDALKSYSSDAINNKISYSFTNLDGKLKEHKTITYHNNGYPALLEQDENGDGKIEKRLTYDLNTHLLSEQNDKDGDGKLEKRTIYSYDDKGNNTVIESYNDDKLIERETINYTYDKKNNIILEEYDYEADGTIDTNFTYAYDTNNNKILDEYKSDGIISSRDIYAYDKNNNLVLSEFYEKVDKSDEEGNIVDSSLILLRRYTYNTNGSILSSEEDEDENGKIDKVSIYIYDINENHVLTEIDIDNDGVIDSLNTYTYNDNGQVTSYKEDYLVDNVIDEKSDYKYLQTNKWSSLILDRASYLYSPLYGPIY